MPVSAETEDLSGVEKVEFGFDLNGSSDLEESEQPKVLQQKILPQVDTTKESYTQNWSTTLPTKDLEPGRYVFLEVSDPGRGIDEVVRNRIFEPFFSTKFTGRGLGLASVLGIVRGHRGAIKLITEAGVGTRFRVLFPPATAWAEPEPAAPESADTSSSRILVIDDDEAVLEVAS